MTNDPVSRIQLLAISGSLRAESANSALLRAMAGMAREGVAVRTYERLASLPPFDPGLDLDATDFHAPEPVMGLRQRLLEADGILIGTPEYAFGMPGVLKNLLDWTVSMNVMDRKPVAVVVASPLPGGGGRAHQGLLWVLEALNADVVEGASLLLDSVRTRMGLDGSVTDPGTAMLLANALDAVIDQVKRHR